MFSAAAPMTPAAGPSSASATRVAHLGAAEVDAEEVGFTHHLAVYPTLLEAP
jgi:hypothetical protein